MNSLAVRLAVAAVILLFAWKQSVLSVVWPPQPTAVDADVPKPDAILMAWAEPLRPILPKMLPADRKYLANLYDAMAFVLARDRDRDDPIVSSTDKFASFHAGTLRLAIDKASVGKYPGLAQAIDQTFLAAAGAEIRPLDRDTSTKLIAACQVLSYVFAVKRDE
jgi:hypothetical protein